MGMCCRCQAQPPKQKERATIVWRFLNNSFIHLDKLWDTISCIQCVEKFWNVIDQIPSVCESNRLHVVIFWFFFIRLRYIDFSTMMDNFLKSWTSTMYLLNSTAHLELVVCSPHLLHLFSLTNLKDVYYLVFCWESRHIRECKVRRQRGGATNISITQGSS